MCQSPRLTDTLVSRGDKQELLREHVSECVLGELVDLLVGIRGIRDDEVGNVTS